MGTRYYKQTAYLLLFLVLVVIATLLSMAIGEVKISFFDIPEILRTKNGLEYGILTKIRFPRIILAFAAGGALSLTGAILQGIFRNPLVEPYTLGISGGAALGVAFVIVTGTQLALGSITLPLGGFAGALLSVIMVYTLSFRKGNVNINRMLLIGVMVSFVSSAAMMFMMSLTTAENIHSIIFWIMGSLDEPNTSLIRITLIAAISGLLISLLYSRSLNALRIGEEKARYLGINTKTAVRSLFVLASILTGICVSVTGVIGFVGLIIPHIIRMLLGSDYRFLLIGSFLGGSFFLIICDIIARTIIEPHELPIGVITGMVGGLVFIIMLSKVKVGGKIL